MSGQRQKLCAKLFSTYSVPYSCLQLPTDPIFRTSEGLSCLVTAFSYSGLPKQPCWQKSRVLYILLSTAILTTQMSSLIAPWNYKLHSREVPVQFTTHGCVGFCSGEWNALGHLKARSRLRSQSSSTYHKYSAAKAKRV